MIFARCNILYYIDDVPGSSVITMENAVSVQDVGLL